MDEIAYSALISVNALCIPCREYKGMMECPECGGEICVFCADHCEGCGLPINWSK